MLLRERRLESRLRGVAAISVKKKNEDEDADTDEGQVGATGMLKWAGGLEPPSCGCSVRRGGLVGVIEN